MQGIKNDSKGTNGSAHILPSSMLHSSFNQSTRRNIDAASK
jgi:hypothetical protein